MAARKQMTNGLGHLFFDKFIILLLEREFREGPERLELDGQQPTCRKRINSIKQKPRTITITLIATR